MFRRCRRAVALAFGLMIVALRVGLLRLRGPLTPRRRALWLQWSSRLLLSIFGIRWRVSGDVPARGLVVSNHLSYLDILVVAAAMPGAFVAKIEVLKWPFFGWTARVGDSLFIDRSSRSSAQAVAREMAGRLERDVPILVFPEGTSSDGSRVMQFHSFLFQPAIEAGAPVTAAAVRYGSDDGAPERELCWFGDAGFLPNLWKILGVPRISAEVRFGLLRVYDDRRTAASEAHDEVVAMRSCAPDILEHDVAPAGLRHG